jgi:HEAT repeat protein
MTTNTMKKDIAKLIEELDASPEGAKKVTLLIELLVEEGHERHEDIVFELGLTGDPGAVPAIAKAIKIPFQELVRWGNLHEFQRKCVYALARIGSDESRAALQEISHSQDERLRQYGEEGLSRWPMPYSADKSK